MNVLADPGFESQSWALSGDPGMAAFVASPVHGGSRALRVSCENGPLVGIARSPVFAVLEGGSYTLSFWWRVTQLVSGFRLFARVHRADTGAAIQAHTFTPLVRNTWALEVRSTPIVAPTDALWLEFLTTAGGTVASVDFHVDDAELDGPEPEVSAVQKYAAHQALVERLATINGSAGGYWTNLGGRVYPCWASPADREDLTLPYLCVPILGEETAFTAPTRHVQRTWEWSIWAFLAETKSDAMQTSQIEAVLNLEDDIIRALSSDWTLGGVVHDLELGRLTEIAGARLGGKDYGELRFPLRLTQTFQRSQLGPDGV